MIILNDDWNIVTAFGESFRSPGGGGNQVVWVVMQKTGSNMYRLECIQPEDQTDVMRTLFAISELCSDSMSRAALKLMAERFEDEDED